jgi:hypothetical protein
MEGAIMSRSIMTDAEILETFNLLKEVVQSQKELNDLFNKRLKLLEESQSRQPLVLTKEMEVKN